MHAIHRTKKKLTAFRTEDPMSVLKKACPTSCTPLSIADHPRMYSTGKGSKDGKSKGEVKPTEQDPPQVIWSDEVECLSNPSRKT